MKEIFERRSVRKYKDQPVSRGQIEQLLKAAMRAPSAVNQQPWEFMVIQDKAKMREIPGFHPYAKMLNEAACAIVVCGNLEKQVTGPYDYWVQDCSAATENLLLEAVHLGLGAVWLGVYPIPQRVKDVQECLGLPEHIVPLNIISLGWPEKAPEPVDTYRPERVHWEKW